MMATNPVHKLTKGNRKTPSEFCNSLISLLMLIVSGCGTSTFWRLDGISAGDNAYDSTRLRYVQNNGDSPLRFEMLKVEEEILSFLSLTQFRWEASESVVHVVFQIGEQQIEEPIPLLEGGMRLKIPSEMTEKISVALERGERVAIFADGFEITLEPDQFARAYNRFQGKRALFQNLLQGPLQ